MTFKITENDGTSVAPSSFTTSSGGSNLYLLMGGPTTDYAVVPIRERADGASFNGTLATYTFTKAIPTDATGKGTWAFSIDARRTVTFDPPPPDGADFTEGAFNKVFYAGVTDSVPVPRRAVVDLAKCNLCQRYPHPHLRQLAVLGHLPPHRLLLQPRQQQARRRHHLLPPLLQPRQQQVQRRHHLLPPLP